MLNAQMHLTFIKKKISFLISVQQCNKLIKKLSNSSKTEILWFCLIKVYIISRVGTQKMFYCDYQNLVNIFCNLTNNQISANLQQFKHRTD